MSDRRLGIAALAALIVLDLVLIFLALRPAPAVPAPATSGAMTDPAAVATAEPTPTPTQPPATAARMVALRADGSAVAVVSGVCGQSASVALAVPATGAPQPTVAPGAVVGRLTNAPDGQIQAVSADAGCTTEALSAQGAPGGEWANQGSPATLYYYFPGATGIATPSGPVTLPCPVASFAITASAGTLLCTDGRILASEGTSWNPKGTLEQGLAIAPGGNDDALVGVGKAAGCFGLAVSTSTDRGTTWSQAGCANGAQPDGEGPVGIGAQGGNLVLVDAAGTAYGSSDGGASFTRKG